MAKQWRKQPPEAAAFGMACWHWRAKDLQGRSQCDDHACPSQTSLFVSARSTRRRDPCRRDPAMAHRFAARACRRYFV
jgi:hypothetical protein